jgi:prevent-host-death family protein
VATLSIHELGRNTQRVISGVDNSGRPVIVPSHGAPVAAIVAIDSEELADIVLSTAPQYLDDLMAAERDMRA